MDHVLGDTVFPLRLPLADEIFIDIGGGYLDEPIHRHLLEAAEIPIQREAPGFAILGDLTPEHKLPRFVILVNTHHCCKLQSDGELPCVGSKRLRLRRLIGLRILDVQLRIGL